MKNFIFATLLCLSLAACLQDNRAPVSYKEGMFYGEGATYDRGGNELPKYNNNNRAQLPQDQEAKYVNDSQHQYGVSAEVGGVQTTDLAPPEPVKTEVLQAPIEKNDAVDSPFVEPKPAIQPKPAIEQQTETNSALLPNFDEDIAVEAKSQPQSQTKAEEKLNWQATKDNAQSEYDAKALQAEAELAKKAGDEQEKIAAIAAPVEPLVAPVVAPVVAPKTPKIEPAKPKTNSADSLKKDKFIWPLKGKILRDYSTDPSKGLVIAGRSGEPVRASASGVVVYVGQKIKSLGTMIIVQHPDGYVTTYSHLGDVAVAQNDNVVGGQLIGFVGKSGDAKQAQLHFALRHNTEAIDPMQKLTK